MKLLLLPLMAGPLISFAQVRNNGGTINISSGATLNVFGTMATLTGSSLVNNGELHLKGSVQNAANLSATSGTLYFDGSTLQTLSGTGTLATTNCRFDNPAGVELTASLTVDGTCDFANGIVRASSAAAPLILTANATIGTVFPASDQSHVNGYVRKSGTGLFSYPVGDGIRFQKIDVSLSANASGMNVRYSAGDGGVAPFTASGSSPALLTAYNANEYWEIQPVSTATGSVTVFWDNYNNGGINSVSDLSVAHKYNGGWQNEGNASASGTVAAGSVTSNSISNWSPFALGSISANSTLAVRDPGPARVFTGSPQRLSLYITPNPANDLITIINKISSQNGKQALITDAGGRVVSKLILQSTNTVDISSWPAGVYFLRTTDGGVIKFVKQ